MNEKGAGLNEAGSGQGPVVCDDTRVIEVGSPEDLRLREENFRRLQVGSFFTYNVEKDGVFERRFMVVYCKEGTQIWAILMSQENRQGLVMAWQANQRWRVRHSTSIFSLGLDELIQLNIVAE
jgi:hypothetical protein